MVSPHPDEQHFALLYRQSDEASLESVYLDELLGFLLRGVNDVTGECTFVCLSWTGVNSLDEINLRLICYVLLRLQE